MDTPPRKRSYNAWHEAMANLSGKHPVDEDEYAAAECAEANARQIPGDEEEITKYTDRRGI